jgi:uncharacterized membrane protein (UPF0127 family)
LPYSFLVQPLRAVQRRAYALVLAGAALGGAALAAHAADLPTTQLSAGIHVIHAEIANTEDTRRTGLMGRQKLGTNEGMIFVFEQPDSQCFWMRNTPIPLSIAFIADDGTIVNIDDMKPETDDAHCSKKPVRYALEMDQGWFASHGIAAGIKIDGLP